MMWHICDVRTSEVFIPQLFMLMFIHCLLNWSATGDCSQPLICRCISRHADWRHVGRWQKLSAAISTVEDAGRLYEWQNRRDWDGVHFLLQRRTKWDRRNHYAIITLCRTSPFRRKLLLLKRRSFRKVISEAVKCEQTEVTHEKISFKNNHKELLQGHGQGLATLIQLISQ